VIVHRYFELKEEAEDKWRENDGDEFDRAKYYSCPISRKPVNPKVLMPNRRLKIATDAFL